MNLRMSGKETSAKIFGTLLPHASFWPNDVIPINVNWPLMFATMGPPESPLHVFIVIAPQIIPSKRRINE